ncbi:glycoside hydrolase family 71 protein [Xylaria bambusicola]|uniref:glycoside hydrolase family 71 protein n=1 Tax=Xylaria bambusicola TaxID=326684 RepID=UPI00200845D0|nr:glycoside hydrolase family 71 protein [Xylaria bambusicola]KAI0518276.1 glycoside hydrolase family 71 protein [Xylaria bambusicola]
MAKRWVAALLAAMPWMVESQAEKPVYAHFIVGIVENYTVDDWKADITQAQEIGIDGFALNCAPERIDGYTPKQLANAYQAAEELGFKMFISFDFAYWSPGDTADITDIVGNYNDGAIVSTFVGDNMDWNAVKSALPNQKITALSNIQDPSFLASAQTGLDGAFSWYAWPTDGGNSIIPGPMTTIWDERFIQNLAGRPYMAPVSPWFFTHFNTKNWVFICEDQPTRRWEQMLTLKPALVEIVTWNDFGESHYISGSQPNHSDDGSSAWASGYPHDGFRTLWAPYIAAYKSGADKPIVESDQLVYWYRTTPKDIVCTSDTLGPPNGIQYLADVVFVATMLTEPAELTMTSGGNAPVTVTIDAGIRTTNFTIGVGQQSFSVSRNGAMILSGTSDKEVTSSCETYNYNPYVGVLSST